MTRFRCLIPLLFLVQIGCSPQPVAEGDLFQAVRSNDRTLVQALLRAGEAVDAQDEDGNTPLFMACLYSDAEIVKLLLDAGAEINAANGVGATPLMRAATRPKQAALLLDAGADVQARSGLGNTALILAARQRGNLTTVKRLLDAGADVNAANIFGATPLMAAVAAEDLEIVELLLNRGADLEAAPEMSQGGFIFGGGRTALMWAAFRGDEPMVKLLLDRGAKVDAFTIGGTALTQAVWAERRGTAQLLLDAGANVNAQDPIGNYTPLHWAASTERSDPGLAKLLIDRGATPDMLGGDSVDGFLGVPQSPLMLASKRGDTPIVKALLDSGAGHSEGAAPRKNSPVWRTVPALDEAAIAEAVARSIPPLQETAAESRVNYIKHVSRQNCVSCHQQFLPMGAVGMARELGLPLDEKAAEEQLVLLRGNPSVPKDSDAQATFHPEPAIDVGYHLLGLHLEKQPANATTDAMAHFLSVMQTKDGRWHMNLPRPPIQSSDVTATALAIFGLQTYSVPGRAKEFAAQVEQGADWLRNASVETNEERSFQLLGLAWAGVSPEWFADLADELQDEQREDGGWAQLPGLDSDAYATGLTLFALAKAAGRTLEDPAMKNGARFLLERQAADGTWHVARRAFPFQPPMESGFPYGADGWISAAGTSWAAMGLAALLDPENPPALDGSLSIPVKSPDPTPAPVAVDPNAPHDFVTDIKPLLERSCLACHSGDRPKGGYHIESREGLLGGGNRGDAGIVPGDPDASLVMECVTDALEDFEMPPLGKREKYPALTQAEIASLRAWIQAGAEWPDAVALQKP